MRRQLQGLAVYVLTYLTSLFTKLLLNVNVPLLLL